MLFYACLNGNPVITCHFIFKRLASVSTSCKCLLFCAIPPFRNRWRLQQEGPGWTLFFWMTKHFWSLFWLWVCVYVCRGRWGPTVLQVKVCPGGRCCGNTSLSPITTWTSDSWRSYAEMWASGSTATGPWWGKQALWDSSCPVWPFSSHSGFTWSR